MNVGEVYASLFKHCAAAQNTASPAAAAFALPVILLEGGAIKGGKPLADGVLQGKQELFYGVDIGLSHKN